MKKILIPLTILLLTGCGNKIVCTTTNGDVSEKHKITYKEDEVIKVETEKVYKFEDEEEHEAFEKIIGFTINQNKNENIEISYKKQKKKYTLTYKYNVQNITEDELVGLGLNKNKTTLVEQLKNNGLKCK